MTDRDGAAPSRARHASDHALAEAVCRSFLAAAGQPPSRRAAARRTPRPLACAPQVSVELTSLSALGACRSFETAAARLAPRSPSLRPVDALALRYVPAGPLLPGVVPQAIPPVATFLSAQPYTATPKVREPVAAGVTYLYASLPQPRVVSPANRRLRPREPERRLHDALAPAITGARRLAVVGVAAAVALTVPFGRIVSYVEDRLDTGTAPLAQPLRGVPLVPGLRLAAAESVVTPQPLARPQLVSSVAGNGLTPIPAPVFAAYSAGAIWANAAQPGCALSWSVLAGIGEVESGHAVSAGALRPGWDGTASPPILGPLLDGSFPGTPRVPDTDGGLLDGNDAVDRAVGPMQFLPSSWAAYAVDASGDGRADPQNVVDAAAAAGLYLCAGGADLSNPAQLAVAVRRYNHSDTYVRAVMAAAAGYLAASYGPGPQGVALAAIAFGYAHLGDPYLWGGNGPLYDCSGLTQAAYRSAGIDIPRTAEQQWQRLPKVAATDLLPGDLVFFNSGEFQPGLPGHVGIYLGSGLMLDDPHTGAFVRIEPIARFGSWVGAARPSLLATFPGAPLPGTGFVLPVAKPTVAPPTPVVVTVLPTPSRVPSLSPSPVTVPTTVPTEAPAPVETTPPVAASETPVIVEEPTATPEPLDPVEPVSP
ncbi:MAG: hypothetical protein QOE45_3015 [Frankiaceae bacterium]|nr:hypothetical protein [Frankiaceae bacterium]